MAVKTITIDLEAYETLRRRKKKGQSFSEVIKEHFRSGSTAADLLRVIEDLDLRDDTLDAVDRLIEERRADPARAAEL